MKTMEPTSNPPPQGYSESVRERGGGQAVQPASGGSNAQLSEANAPLTVLWRILAIVIGGLFVYAGALKAWDPVRFAGDIENYHVFPWAVNVRLAFYLPWLEMICGLALIFRRLYSGALALVLALMVVFIGASIAAKARGIDISCGCFGHVSDQLSFAWHLVLDFAILGAVVALWFSERHSQSKIAVSLIRQPEGLPSRPLAVAPASSLKPRDFTKRN